MCNNNKKDQNLFLKKWENFKQKIEKMEFNVTFVRQLMLCRHKSKCLR